jgi:hypothetical protein
MGTLIGKLVSGNVRLATFIQGQQDGCRSTVPKGTFKVELGPGKHEVSAIFKPTQSTIVFSRTRPGELASEYQVHHTRPGQFGRFDEAAVVDAARELALALASRMPPQAMWWR